MSTTTAAAVLGRLLTGFVVDRLNRRLVASATLVIQIIGLAVLAWAPSVVSVYAGCALFGLGVGNLTTLPGLILAVEWPREGFSALVGLVVGINQFTFAFGPSLVGVLRDWAGTYGPALGACMALQAVGCGHDPARARAGAVGARLYSLLKPARRCGRDARQSPSRRGPIIDDSRAPSALRGFPPSPRTGTAR